MSRKNVTKLAMALLASVVAVGAISGCGTVQDSRNSLIVSVRDQRMLLVQSGKAQKLYPVSTSKFGVGTANGSKRTPLGNMKIAKKIGGNAPSGAVFKSRRRTGEILPPNAPGRDPIVTRILWLSGKDYWNRNTFGRYIYIHGTPEEYNIGRPASYGCIRMKSKDVIDLYRRVGVGADVKVIRGSLDRTAAGRNYYARNKWAKPTYVYNH